MKYERNDANNKKNDYDTLVKKEKDEHLNDNFDWNFIFDREWLRIKK